MGSAAAPFRDGGYDQQLQGQTDRGSNLKLAPAVLCQLEWRGGQLPNRSGKAGMKLKNNLSTV